VVPLRSSSTYAFEYAATSSDGRRLKEMWDETLHRYPAEHARFVLHKGDDPPADTFLPAHQLVGRLRARIVPERTFPVVRAGQSVTHRVQVTNTGNVTWKARGRRFGGQVTLGLKVCNAADEVLREDLGRTPLPHDVAPGGEVDLDVTVAGVLPPGQYQVRYDMVVEGVIWFELDGSACARGALEVNP
jgi:hypothetical protein